jgi:hypothetical protein
VVNEIRKPGDFTTNLGGHDIIEWRTFHPNVFYIINKQWKRDMSDPKGIVYCTLSDGTEAWVPYPLAVKWAKTKKTKTIRICQVYKLGHPKGANR